MGLSVSTPPAPPQKRQTSRRSPPFGPRTSATASSPALPLPPRRKSPTPVLSPQASSSPSLPSSPSPSVPTTSPSSARVAPGLGKVSSLSPRDSTLTPNSKPRKASISTK